MTAKVVRGECSFERDLLFYSLCDWHATICNERQIRIPRTHFLSAGVFEVLAVELYMLKTTWD